MAAAIFIRAVSRRGKVTALLDEITYSATWWKTVELALLSLKRSETYGSNGALARKTSSVKQYLVEEFGEQIIRYGGFQECPPRSPDLTAMDFFLWGYLKQQVYATPPPTLQDLQ
ncbi:hypothetical protein AVEN_99576-1 [Araneus ventricosus]|uniref:DUF4817 domain-containing protein n=1 Tax=Araneus ventricosus TaxID=182803 RepID=A0A4Y2IBV6_ARAVE|nr:hypothetical protein AVEN_99576-1 [Araneus ventricosus]